MDLTLAEQRKDIDKTISFLEYQIKEMNHQKDVLTRAFNSIDENKEDMLSSNSILAQEVRNIMLNIRRK